jgi:hypothetical protein
LVEAAATATAAAIQAEEDAKKKLGPQKKRSITFIEKMKESLGFRAKGKKK